MISSNGIMMIEPKGHATIEPVIDDLTRKMTAAWRKKTTNPDGYRGWHTCVCGAHSDNHDHYISGLLTNSLCIHYLAFHRQEVPPEELAKVAALAFGEEEPNSEELGSPQKASSKPNVPNFMR